MMSFRELLASVTASMARTETDVARAAEKAASYKGPLRGHADVIDVEARLIEDPLALSGPEEAI